MRECFATSACLRFEDCISYLLSSLGFASSWQLSCSLRLLSQATSVPCPPSNDLDPECHSPWQPDHHNP
ncbi:hypothetical protein CHARACLAT_030613 [Characodon lateralis]|uniref:Uncharacterized protein n=1 Tax=Characodon lateralis TaxID=208331 RepID=A0ABU7F7C3_9TELE|nr:hypothetical protein [Characodon lateralis]